MEKVCEALFEMPPLAVVLTDSEGVIKRVNAKYYELTGDVSGNVVGTSILACGQGVDYVLHILKSGINIEDTEIDLHSKNGAIKTVLVNAERVEEEGQTYFLATFFDISSRKVLEKHILQAQKMEAIATLAGGVAHDFNNIMMAIQGYLSMLLTRIEQDDPNCGLIRKAEKSIARGSELTHSLIGFVENISIEMRRSDVARVVKNAVDLYGRSHRDVNIAMVVDKAEKVSFSLIAEQPITQCLINIFENAVRADCKRIDISIEVKELQHEVTHPYGLNPGKFVQISIKDNGKGMRSDEVAKVFNPFFTTREIGRGAGLGLAAVYCIVKNHRGIVDLESFPGKGTTLKIFLPFAEMIADAKKEVVKKPSILIIDDEDQVLDVYELMAEVSGFEPVLANGGVEGLAKYGKNEKYDLVILDWIMPDISGREVLAEIRRMNPGQKVIVSSGFASSSVCQDLDAYSDVSFLKKPFTIEVFSDKLMEVIKQ